MENLYAFFKTVSSLLTEERVIFFALPDFIALVLLCWAAHLKSISISLLCVVLGVILFALQTMTYVAIGAGNGGAAFTLSYLGASLLLLIAVMVIKTFTQ